MSCGQEHRTTSNFKNEITTERHKSFNRKNRHHLFLHQNLSEFNRTLLQRTSSIDPVSITLCSYDHFCCDLSYKYSGNLSYYFVVYSGLSPVGGGTYNLGVQQCGVVWCKTSDIDTCAFVESGALDEDTFGPFTITSSGMISDVVLPIGNVRNLSLIESSNFDFKSLGSLSSLSAKRPITNLLVAALYGRVFSRDN